MTEKEKTLNQISRAIGMGALYAVIAGTIVCELQNNFDHLFGYSLTLTVIAFACSMLARCTARGPLRRAENFDGRMTQKFIASMSNNSEGDVKKKVQPVILSVLQPENMIAATADYKRAFYYDPKKHILLIVTKKPRRPVIAIYPCSRDTAVKRLAVEPKLLLAETKSTEEKI